MFAVKLGPRTPRTILKLLKGGEGLPQAESVGSSHAGIRIRMAWVSHGAADRALKQDAQFFAGRRSRMLIARPSWIWRKRCL